MRGLEGCTSIPALQPVPCPSRSCMGIEGGMGALYISIPGQKGVVLLVAIHLSECSVAHELPLNL